MFECQICGKREFVEFKTDNDDLYTPYYVGDMVEPEGWTHNLIVKVGYMCEKCSYCVKAAVDKAIKDLSRDYGEITKEVNK